MGLSWSILPIALKPAFHAHAANRSLRHATLTQTAHEPTEYRVDERILGQSVLARSGDISSRAQHWTTVRQTFGVEERGQAQCSKGMVTPMGSVWYMDLYAV